MMNGIITTTSTSGPSSLPGLLAFVREYSPFYRDLYAHVTASDPGVIDLRHLPLIPHASYWECNKLDDNTVRTGPLIDGVVFKTGGTTGNPKYTALTQGELQRTASQLASGLVAAGLRAGDRVANMFYAGELWGSFLLHILSTMAAPVPAVQIPVGGLSDPAVHEKLLRECRVTAILSTVTSLVRLAQYMLPRNSTLPLVHAVMFGGEAMYPDQQDLLAQLFPNATFQGCIFGSMDAGVIAETAGTGDTRVYKAFRSTGTLEICSDGPDNEVIEENHVEGLLVATSWIRHLTPVIRYPTGDRGEWIDRDAGLFRVLGRADVGVRLGPVSLDTHDLKRIVRDCMGVTPVLGTQAVLMRRDGVDAFVVCIAANPCDPSASENKIRVALYEERPMLKQHVELGLIGGVDIKFVPWEELHINPRTGKQMDVWDLRFSP